MSDQTSVSKIGFEVGSEDQLAEFHTKQSSQPASDEVVSDFYKTQLPDIQIRIGTLLKTDTVSFLLGAGASKDCGGVLIGAIPVEIERELILSGISGERAPRVRKWLRHFYQAVRMVNPNDTNIPDTRNRIIERQTALREDNPSSLKANYESVLSLIHRWRAALPDQGGRLRIGNEVDLESSDIDECLRRATYALVKSCQLPVQGKEKGFDAYKKFVRKVLTRPLNLKRSNIFSLNYDTLFEQAADAEGVVLLDGFVGSLDRVFRPESYDQDLYFPAETTEGRVHRHDRVIHLYKLHGSATWVSLNPEWNNPFGLTAKAEIANPNEAVVVYPTPTKYGDTLGMPYAELFRRFAAAIVQPQSTLIVIGYGFGDEHVNAIIRLALTVPSFTLVIVSPNARNDFVNLLREQKDKRVWIFSGSELGTFSGFAEHVLPDLRDEDIRRQVVKTHRALSKQISNTAEALADG